MAILRGLMTEAGRQDWFAVALELFVVALGPMVAGSLVMKRDCRVDLSHWDVDAILQGIADSPGTRADLTYWLSHQNLIIRLFRSQAIASSKMRARVEQERLS